jgi:urease accessory protein
VVVEAGARVRTAAATVTLPGLTTPESHAFWTLEIAGDLDVDPQPTVVAATSRHFTSTRLGLSGSGRVRLRERIQIGRSDKRLGFWSGSLHADVEGSPLLRHRIELGRESGSNWPLAPCPERPPQSPVALRSWCARTPVAR